MSIISSCQISSGTPLANLKRRTHPSNIFRYSKPVSSIMCCSLSFFLSWLLVGGANATKTTTTTLHPQQMQQVAVANRDASPRNTHAAMARSNDIQIAKLLGSLSVTEGDIKATTRQECGTNPLVKMKNKFTKLFLKNFGNIIIKNLKKLFKKIIFCLIFRRR